MPKISLRILIIFLWWPLIAAAQEFNCTVTVDASSLEGTSKDIFDELQEKMTDYMNNTRWTDQFRRPHEKIESRLFLTVRNITGNRFQGDVQIQMMRPVYNSSYLTTVLNMKDGEVEFDFSRGDRLEYNEYNRDGNLTSLLDFYALMMLGLDADTFSLRGGQEWWERASGVFQASQSSNYPGWRLFGDSGSRSSILRSMTEPSGVNLRTALYVYHLKGLDEMSGNLAKGRAGVIEAITKLAETYGKNPMTDGIALWHDAKLDEIISVMSGAPRDERERVYRLLNPIWGADEDRLQKIMNP